MQLHQIGIVRSSLRDLAAAPRQGEEGAPGAWVEVHAQFAEALRGIAAGQELLLLTWLHLGARDVLVTHPRNDPGVPLTGVFLTRSPDRPNPIGLHPVRVEEVDGTRIRVAPLEAVDGTPVIDIKSL